MFERIIKTTIACLCCLSMAWAQKPASGILQYVTIFTESPGNTQRTACKLLFLPNESIVVKLSDPGSATAPSVMLYKNLTTSQLISQDDADGEPILTDEVLKAVDWKMLPQTRQFGQYTGQKARAKVRGRTYTVWFTKQVEARTGPWKLHGLPGLILEAEDDTHEVKFEFVSLTTPLPKNIALKAPVPAVGQKRMSAAGRDKYVAQKYDAIRRQLASKPGFTNTRVDIQPGKTIELPD